MILSSSGNRLFYRATVDVANGYDTVLVFSDRKENGWSEPQIIDLPDIQSEEGQFAPYIYDVANDGKTIVVCCGKQGLAAVHEKNGQWSEPIYLDYFPSICDSVQISEDGAILALNAAGNPKDEYNKEFSLWTYAFQNETQWTKERLNPEGKYVYGDVLLSADGKKIYWIQ